MTGGPAPVITGAASGGPLRSSVALRPYQLAVGRAVLESVRRRLGLTFTVQVARQGGKNELSAQLEALLLVLHMVRGGDAVKAAPTFTPQALVSLERLKARLREAGFAPHFTVEHGHVLRLGRARQVFLSAEPAASVVGATASLLLEVDEAQDVDPDKYQKDFRPMGATANVTTVLYGTPWDGRSLLEQQTAANRELERRDGIQRDFRYDWQAVAAHNPAYAAYVAAERERLGEDHPLFRTQYRLESLDGGRGLFTRQQLAWLQGAHPRRHAPLDGAAYVAGVDIAGEAEGGAAGPDAWTRAREPRRDSTVATIARVVPPPGGGPESARVEVVDQVWWTGRSLDQSARDLAALLGRTWRCRAVVVDATGIGAASAGILRRALGEGVVEPFVFTAPAKSRLGFELLAAVNAQRLSLYAADGSPEHAEALRQLGQAQARYRPGGQMDFFVDAREGHDDFVMSLALAVAAAARYAPRSARGRPSPDGLE